MSGILVLGRPLCQAAIDILAGAPRIDKAVLWVGLDRPDVSKFDKVDLVCTPCTGTDHLDEVRGLGIPTLSLRDCGDLSGIRATVEHTIGLILALTRKIPAAAEHTRAGGWDRYRWTGNELAGKRTLIVGGMGRIGYRIAMILEDGMDMDCELSDTNTRYPGNLMEQLPLADLVTVHVPLNDSTRGMFGPKQFAAMKPGAWFVNTSRGAVVDEGALFEALVTGHLAGAALDVLCEEPPPTWSPGYFLMKYAADNPDRLIITPHLGGCTVESMEQAECLLARRLVEELSK